MELDQLLAPLLSEQGALVVLLIAILVSGARGWWVWGWHYRQVAKERDAWRQLALSGTTLAEKAVSLVEREAA